MFVFCSLYPNHNFWGVKDTSGKVIPTVLTIRTLPSSRCTATATLVCSVDFLCEAQSRLNLIRAIAHFFMIPRMFTATMRDHASPYQPHFLP